MRSLARCAFVVSPDAVGWAVRASADPTVFGGIRYVDSLPATGASAETCARDVIRLHEGRRAYAAKGVIVMSDRLGGVQ
jgi:hypothetical protein